MKTPLFSIIIPCYNTSEYLEKCLKSVLCQKYQNWEIILINDGSTDNTEEIVHQYADQDIRIKTFTQDNQGLSGARNRGIKEAAGDYILLLDSDDWYKNETSLQSIAQILEENLPDIVAFDFQSVDNDGHMVNGGNNLHFFEEAGIFICSGEQYLYYVLSQPNIYPWYPWRYAFKRDFWMTYQFGFRLRAYEDIDLIYRILLRAQKISILNEPVYQYRRGRKNAITQQTKESYKSMLNVCRNSIDTVNHMDLKEDLKGLLNNNFSHGYFTVLNEAYCLPKKDREEIFHFLNANRILMDYTITKKRLLVKHLIPIMGLHITSRMLFMRMKLYQKVNENGRQK